MEYTKGSSTHHNLIDRITKRRVTYQIGVEPIQTMPGVRVVIWLCLHVSYKIHYFMFTFSWSLNDNKKINIITMTALNTFLRSIMILTFAAQCHGYKLQ